MGWGYALLGYQPRGHIKVILSSSQGQTGKA